MQDGAKSWLPSRRFPYHTRAGAGATVPRGGHPNDPVAGRRGAVRCRPVRLAGRLLASLGTAVSVHAPPAQRRRDGPGAAQRQSRIRYIPDSLPRPRSGERSGPTAAGGVPFAPRPRPHCRGHLSQGGGGRARCAAVRRWVLPVPGGVAAGRRAAGHGAARPAALSAARAVRRPGRRLRDRGDRPPGAGLVPSPLAGGAVRGGTAGGRLAGGRAGDGVGGPADETGAGPAGIADRPGERVRRTAAHGSRP